MRSLPPLRFLTSMVSPSTTSVTRALNLITFGGFGLLPPPGRAVEHGHGSVSQATPSPSESSRCGSPANRNSWAWAWVEKSEQS